MVAPIRVATTRTPARRLSWPVEKTHGRNNHAPKFRPTEDNHLFGRERTLSRLVLDAVKQIDPGLAAKTMGGEATATDVLAAVTDAFAPAQPELTEVLLGAFRDGAKEMEYRIRKEINTRLQQLGSPVRLTEPTTTKSAVEKRSSFDRMDWTIGEDAFNQVNSQAVLWAQNESAQLVTNMSTSQQGAIQTVVSAAHTAEQMWATGRTTTGLTRRQTSQALVGVLRRIDPVSPVGSRLAGLYGVHAPGLTTRYERAVVNFADNLADQLASRGVADAKIERVVQQKTTRYADKLRRARARNIARTEIMTAANKGQLFAIDKAVSDGLVRADEAGKQWVTGPTDVCPICSSLSGVIVGPRESFVGVGDAPPAHPSCRCIIRLVPRISKAPTARGVGDPAFPVGSSQNPMVWDFSGGATTAPPVVPTTPVAPAPPITPPVPVTPTPVAAPPPGPKMAESVIYDSTAKAKKVVDPVVEKIDDALVAPKGYSTGPTSVKLRSKGKMEGEAGFFSPRKKIPVPSEPTRPRVRFHFDTQAEYDEAIKQYQEAYARYQLRLNEYRAQGGVRSQIEVFGKGTADDVGKMQNTLSHEWGHRLDYEEVDISTGRGIAERSRMKTTAVNESFGAAGPGEKAAVEFLEGVTQSEAFSTLTELASAIDPKWVEYATSPQELWARAFSQWMATKHGTAEMAAAMTAETTLPAVTKITNVDTQWFGMQWRDREFTEKIAPLVEDVLRSWGLLT